MLVDVRVIAGTYRSRPLEAPAGLDTRPTTDRLRETLFNVLAPRIEGSRFADLYAGSGAVGIEALSRGARDVQFVERAEPALKAIRANLAKLGIRIGPNLHASSVLGWIKRNPAPGFDLIFLDPPYDAMEEYEAVLNQLGRLLAPEGLVVAEHRRRDRLAASYGRLERTRLLEQGDAALSFYALAEPPPLAQL
jgi:16S rRNA (guanine(966)-N(2))-methyltransferase RsmD